MQQKTDLSGTWKVCLEDGSTYSASVPGTLELSGIGKPDLRAEKWHPDAAIPDPATLPAPKEGEKLPPITTRLTRSAIYTGRAVWSRTFELPAGRDKESRFFLHIERSRKLEVRINGQKAEPLNCNTLSAPTVYEITSFASSGSGIKEYELEISVDNSYSGWPAESIICSSAATNETQTNWNGLLGEIFIEEKPSTFIQDIKFFPEDSSCSAVRAVVTVNAAEQCEAEVKVEAPVFAEGPLSKKAALSAGQSSLVFESVPVRQDSVPLWDEYKPSLFDVTGTLFCGGKAPVHTASVRTGLRSFYAEKGLLMLNSHPFFVRGEANCAAFPQTGHLPCDKESWKKILATYRSYGFNMIRFHSHCPPEAAFAAADEAGMLLQPELSNWDPRTAFSTPEAKEYYAKEIKEIQSAYADHPSFVMLSFGNELQYAEKDADFVRQLVENAIKTDPSRLYSAGSNNFYGANGWDGFSQFYTCAKFDTHLLRGTSAGMHGHINCSETFGQNYDQAMTELRKVCPVPVFTFETGQYEVLPDFDQLEKYTGITRANNLNEVRKQVEERGFMPQWKDRVAASGELSLLSYREEFEAALRTKGLSGVSFLSLQDFPGQGTALVGMLDAHLDPKPFDFARPERFAEFFRQELPLAVFKNHVNTCGTVFETEIHMANYGSEKLKGVVSVSLGGRTQYIAEHVSPAGQTSLLAKIPLVQEEPGESELRISFLDSDRGQTFENTYRLWFFKKKTDFSRSEYSRTAFADSLEQALELTEQGRTVFYEPSPEDILKGMGTHFTTDFWSVGTFPHQEGYMGLLCDPQNPLLRKFPTENHSDWQWHNLTETRAVQIPFGSAAEITALDCYARLRNCALLFSSRLRKGTLVVSSMQLQKKQADHPECRLLLESILDCLESGEFRCSQSISEENLSEILR